MRCGLGRVLPRSDRKSRTDDHSPPIQNREADPIPCAPDVDLLDDIRSGFDFFISITFNQFVHGWDHYLVETGPQYQQ
jgi:hypothetical protein